MVDAIGNALGGLLASQKRVEASASNIANFQSAGAIDPANGPPAFDARTVIQTPLIDENGVVFGLDSEIIPKQDPTQTAFDPDSPFANEEGLINIPNVNLSEEIVNLNLAEITFKANARVIEAASELSREVTNILGNRSED